MLVYQAHSYPFLFLVCVFTLQIFYWIPINRTSGGIGEGIRGFGDTLTGINNFSLFTKSIDWLQYSLDSLFDISLKLKLPVTWYKIVCNILVFHCPLCWLVVVGDAGGLLMLYSDMQSCWASKCKVGQLSSDLTNVHSNDKSATFANISISRVGQYCMNIWIRH